MLISQDFDTNVPNTLTGNDGSATINLTDNSPLVSGSSVVSANADLGNLISAELNLLPSEQRVSLIQGDLNFNPGDTFRFGYTLIDDSDDFLGLSATDNPFAFIGIDGEFEKLTSTSGSLFEFERSFRIGGLREITIGLAGEEESLLGGALGNFDSSLEIKDAEITAVPFGVSKNTGLIMLLGGMGLINWRRQHRRKKAFKMCDLSSAEEN